MNTCIYLFPLMLYSEYWGMFMLDLSFSAPQLCGSFVLAVGLWLRFDPETVQLLTVEEAPKTFFIGESSSQ